MLASNEASLCLDSLVITGSWGDELDDEEFLSCSVSNATSPCASSATGPTSSAADADDRLEDMLEVVMDVPGKPESDLNFVADARAGVQLGLVPSAIASESTSQCYYLRSQGAICAVFKPWDEEACNALDRLPETGGLRRGIFPGEGCMREVAAYLLDHGAFAGVPATVLVRVVSRAWQRQLMRGGSGRGSSSSGSGRSLSLPSLSPRSLTSAAFADWPVPRAAAAPSAPGPATRRPHAESASSAMLLELCAGDAGKAGSLQRYVSHHSTAEDVAAALLPASAVQRIAALDLRMLNTDRHCGNILLQTVYPEPHVRARARACSPAFAPSSLRETPRACAKGRRSESFCEGAKDSELHLVPIDHGLSLPRISEVARMASAADSGEGEGFGGDGGGSNHDGAETITLEWMAWAQSALPVCEDVRAYIAALDADADAALLREALDGCLGEEELLTLRVCTRFLQRAVARGKTLRDVGAAVRDGTLSERIRRAQLPASAEDAAAVAAFLSRFERVLDEAPL